MTDAHHRVVVLVRTLEERHLDPPTIASLHARTAIPLRTVQHVVKTSDILSVNGIGEVYLTGEPYTCKTCGGQR